MVVVLIVFTWVSTIGDFFLSWFLISQWLHSHYFNVDDWVFSRWRCNHCYFQFHDWFERLRYHSRRNHSTTIHSPNTIPAPSIASLRDEFLVTRVQSKSIFSTFASIKIMRRGSQKTHHKKIYININNEESDDEHGIPEFVAVILFNPLLPKSNYRYCSLVSLD